MPLLLWMLGRNETWFILFEPLDLPLLIPVLLEYAHASPSLCTWWEIMKGYFLSLRLLDSVLLLMNLHVK